VLEGRYGPYVKHGSTNATLPKGVTPEQVGLDQALSLLAAKAEAGGKKPARKAGARTPTKARGGGKAPKASTPKKGGTRK
jgi:DNA topoisomerase-1